MTENEAIKIATHCLGVQAEQENGRRYGKSRACRFFEKDYEESEEE